uniref:Mitochondrial resolvase Ydc2 catalytic domain-containing protein n=1 Tax=Megaviridae environmental sample TaxID=1737588 RepID=A0A5J6VIM1_9VIRU|nr:MAG: hypothetical protein [Megaviridae environmental sample]
MKVLSFDVGIINLAYCLLEVKDNKVSILEWDIIDILQKVNNPMCHLCDGDAIKSSKINYVKYCERCICNVDVKTCKKPKLYTGKNIDVDILKYHLIQILDSKKHLLQVDSVVIENQPSLKNPKMKAVSNCIYDFYLIRGKFDASITTIKFMSPLNKSKIMKDVPEELHPTVKTKYTFTKKLAIICAKRLLEGSQQKITLEKHKKKDDLCDAFLQGWYYLKILNNEIEINI